MPYREQAERPKIAPEDLRYFTLRDEVEKGPFERHALLRSIKAGKLHAATLVRAEDENEWHPLSHIRQVVPPERRPRAEFDPERDVVREPGREWAGDGSFVKGLVIGFLGGVIGWGLAEFLGTGPETKRGARVGVIAQLVLGLIARALK